MSLEARFFHSELDEKTLEDLRIWSNGWWLALVVCYLAVVRGVKYTSFNCGYLVLMAKER